MKKAILLTAALFFSAGSFAKTVWIDVRTPAEYAEGHVQGARNYPLDEVEKAVAQSDIEKGDTILLYCRSGRRSAQAQQILLAAGYANAQNLGGFSDLEAAGAVKTEK